MALAEMLELASLKNNSGPPGYTETIPFPWKHACLLLNLNTSDIVPRAHDFILGTSSPTHREKNGLEDLYLDFFHDQKRAGTYHINSEIYARVALQCIENM